MFTKKVNGNCVRCYCTLCIYHEFTFFMYIFNHNERATPARVISYYESAYLIIPVELLKAILYDYFGILVYFVYFILIQITLNLHMTNSKLRNSDSAYSICFSQVLSTLFTFLINTQVKR